MIGQSISHYQILDKLGEGGMGVVYKARDTHLDRFVAIKVLPPEKVADPERKRRFVQEAKAASALNHPNIITIHDIASDGGRDFIVMEYVAGRTLEQLIGRKGLKLNETLKCAMQIADALAVAHAAGIVHRDLKPGNVMVTESGLVKVLDFGLAKLTEAVVGEEAPTRTAEGTILGTLAYMSPEQAEGKRVDARSDIFSFGAVLYEMLTGRRAFQRDSRLSTLAAILREEPQPVTQVAAETPRDLEKIIIRCLRKDPARRYQHMDDVKLALEELKEESDSGALAAAPAAERKPRRKLAWVAAVAVVLAAVSLGIWFLAPRAQAPATQLRAVPLTSYPGNESYPSFSPDGNQVAFCWDGEKGDNMDIYVKPIGPGTPLRLTTDPAWDSSPAWSPDGRWIAFWRALAGKWQIILIPPLGGPERLLAQMDSRRLLPGPYLAWAPDGKWLAGPYKDSPEGAFALFLFSIESGEKHRLTSPPADSLGDTSPAFSPDGRRLVFSRARSAAANDLHVLSLTSAFTPEGEPRRLTFDTGFIRGAVWTPDGREIIYSSGTAGGVLWRIAASGSAKAQQLPFAAEDAAHPTISRGSQRAPGRLAYSWGFSDQNIWRLEIPGPGQGASRSALISSSRQDSRPQYSPDGKRVAFMSDRSGSMEIWTCRSDGSNCVQLTSFGGPWTGSPSWSPDGKYIVFDSRAPGQPDLYVVSAEGGKPQRLTTHPASDSKGSWSRDGRWIYFASLRTGEYQVWKMPWAAGVGREGEAVQVTRKGGFVAKESPDGRFVYYVNSRYSPGLWRVPPEGGEGIEVLPALGGAEQWFAVVERGIYFIPPRNPDRTYSIQFLEFASGKITSIATIDKPLSSGLTVSPDGRSLLYTQVDQQGSDLMLVENFR